MNTTHESPVQSSVARTLAIALTAQGFVVAEGEYDLRRTVEVRGRDRRHLVVVPLHQFFADEPDAPDADDWLLMLRAVDGQLVDAPDVDGPGAPFGCPSIWDVTPAGEDLDAGLAWFLRNLEILKEQDFVPALGVLPASPASMYSEHPYPGERPSGSWVVDHDALVWPVMPDPEAPSGWSVVDARVVCLDAWLHSHGASPMASRLPVLSYGSNANPAKVVRNGASLPGVHLQAQVHDLASVYCAGTRGHDGAVPATLIALPGHSEGHVLSWVVTEDFAALDVIEGRAGAWYDLVALTLGSVVLADGTEPDEVLAYVAGRPERFPLQTAQGDFLLVGETTQSEARAAVARWTGHLVEPEVIGVVRGEEVR